MDSVLISTNYIDRLVSVEKSLGLTTITAVKDSPYLLRDVIRRKPIQRETVLHSEVLKFRRARKGSSGRQQEVKHRHLFHIGYKAILPFTVADYRMYFSPAHHRSPGDKDQPPFLP